MGCPCENNEIKLTEDMKSIDQEIIKRANSGFNTNIIAAQLMVSKAYVEEVLAPKPVVKTSKKRKKTITEE
jgi:hypothetical protein